MKSFSATGIVLKRSNFGELDRVVTLLTKEQGKLACIAKGSRRLTSSKLAALEPGTLIKGHFVPTKGLPLLTQAQIINDFAGLKSDLTHIRNLFQILEMLDAILAEGDPQPEVFTIVLELFATLEQKKTNKTAAVRQAFTHILSVLGFSSAQAQDSKKPLRDFIEHLTQHKLKAFAFLSSTP